MTLQWEALTDEERRIAKSVARHNKQLTRNLAIMRYMLEGHDYKDAAQVFALSAQTIKTIVDRMLRIVKANVAPDSIAMLWPREKFPHAYWYSAPTGAWILVPIRLKPQELWQERDFLLSVLYRIFDLVQAFHAYRAKKATGEEKQNDTAK